MINGFIQFYLVSQLAYVISSSEDLGEVIFTNILYRHGDRTPISSYPNDPYKNISFWPVAWGELTNAGKERHYELGKWLRQRYSKLLPMEYSKEDIFIRSTDIDRTLMSAYSNLAGLYEPDMEKNWSPTIRWQPIPVHTTALELDGLLSMSKPCPRYESYLKQLIKSEAFKKMEAENKELYEYAAKHAGKKKYDFVSIGYLYDTLFIESLFNYTLPKWTEKIYPEPLRRLAVFSFTVDCYNQKMARLQSGPLIKEMTMNMKDKINGKLTPDRKAMVYSAHDTTVANFLHALRMFDPQTPPYRSVVLVELRRKEGNHFVTIFYRNSTEVPPYFLRLPGCDKLCPFDKFRKIVDPLIPVDWDKECQLSMFTESLYGSISSSVLILSVLLTTTSLLFLILGIRFYKNRFYIQNDFVYESLKPEIHS